MSIPKTEIELLQCPVKSVVVYPDRAEVTRLVKVTLDAGEQEIQFKNISKALDKDSVRIDGVGSASIVEVSFHEVPVTKEQDNQDELRGNVSELEKEIDKMVEGKAELKSKVKRLETQQALLEKYSNQLTAASHHANRQSLAQGETLDSFFDFMDKYDEQSVDLNIKLYKLQTEISQLEDSLKAARTKLTTLKPMIKKEDGEPIKQPILGVLLFVKNKGDIQLLVSYVVSDAGWSPKYDLRVTSSTRTMEVGYFGMVKQKTGEDWNDTKLSLSTASPSISGNAPELETCKVNLIHFDNQRDKDNYYHSARSRNFHLDYDRIASGLSGVAMDGMSNQQVTVSHSQVTEGITSSVFEIAALATIPSDDSAHKVSIASIDLKPSFEYETVPKLSQHAFLKAKVKNESRYTLLAGPANVFLDQAFVTKSSIPNVSPQEEFGCSLGSDPSVRVVYKPINKYREQSGLITVSVVYTYKQVTEITNNRNEVATILFTDHIPLSKDDKLKVTMLEPQIAKVRPGQAPPNPNFTPQSHVTWSLELQPNESKQVTVRYTVEYPRNKQVEGL